MVFIKNIGSKEKGFTLIEVVLSILILGLVVAAFTQLFGSGYVNVTINNRKVDHLYQAQEIMEEQFAKNYNQLTDISSTEGDVTVSEEQTKTITIANGDTIDVTGKTVTVSIPYTVKNSQQRTVSVTSFIPEGG